MGPRLQQDPKVLEKVLRNLPKLKKKEQDEEQEGTEKSEDSKSVYSQFQSKRILMYL